MAAEPDDIEDERDNFDIESEADDLDAAIDAAAAEARDLASSAGAVKQDAPAQAYSVISAGEFVARQLPPRVSIIEGVLYNRSLVELHAWRGIGKTWIAMIMARCIALGQPFLHSHWTVPQKRRVLFVDGEMAAIDLQERLKKLGPEPEMLDLMISEFLWGAEGQGLVLNNPDHQARLIATLKDLTARERRPEVIFFDNLSSLTAGIDENSNSEQDELLAFFRQLRHEGYTVVFVHHDGKAGVQRGASRREDFLDLVIHLFKPKPGKKGDEDDGAEMAPLEPKFNFEFTKSRGMSPRPAAFTLELITGPTGNLTTSTEQGARAGARSDDIEQKMHILRHICEAEAPVTRADVAKKWDITKSTANEHVQKLIKEGLMDGAAGPLRVTPRGLDRLARLFKDLTKT